MSYLNEFQKQIANNDFPKFMLLWEEYCSNDTVDIEEFVDLLKAIKGSDIAKLFGKYIETAIPLWQLITDPNDSYNVLRLLIDVQNSNTPMLADLATKAIKEKYPNDPDYNERARLVGLRTRDNFLGALSNYDLLAHMKKGKFVFHHGGWGTGEIIDVSPIREQLTIEFENIRGRKDLSFENAFKILTPLPDENFLARRFSNPDQLEKEAKENPVAVMRMLLKDLGPKSASEIKDELCELVIPEDDWTKWWQNARTKIKKDTMIESPENLRDPFILRKSEVTHAERFKNALSDITDIDDIIQTTYSYARDIPNMVKNQEMQKTQEKLDSLLKDSQTSPVQKLQIYLLLENHFNYKTDEYSLQKIVQELDPEKLISLIQEIDIVAFRKRVLVAIREYRKDYIEIFLKLLVVLPQAILRDYLLKELSNKETLPLLQKKLQELLQNPGAHPDLFLWYFNKVVNDEEVLFNNKEGQCQFFEAFLILFSILENRPEQRDMVKKMYQLLSGKRYALVRKIFENTNIDFIKESLLLTTKCQTLTDHDMKILRSLAEVVHPSLSEKKKGSARIDHNTIWTTEEGYFKVQERIKRIGTTEIVENAREIEVARAHGDLRENSEYKFALEKRSRLQAELKMLSEQLNHARIITPEDVPSEEVGIGTIIKVSDGSGKTITYTILGPWDADADKNILSFQSKLALAMMGYKRGSKFKFREDEFEVVNIKSIFDK